MLNRSPSKTLKSYTPYFALYGTHPHYDHLRVFGCKCYPNLAATAPHKLVPRSTLCVFMGYPSEHKGYRCLDLASNRIIISRHVIFDESSFPFAELPTPLSSSNLDFLTDFHFSPSPVGTVLDTGTIRFAALLVPHHWLLLAGLASLLPLPVPPRNLLPAGVLLYARHAVRPAGLAPPGSGPVPESLKRALRLHLHARLPGHTRLHQSWAPCLLLLLLVKSALARLLLLLLVNSCCINNTWFCRCSMRYFSFCLSPWFRHNISLALC